jgi:hypothetical protein
MSRTIITRSDAKRLHFSRVQVWRFTKQLHNLPDWRLRTLSQEKAQAERSKGFWRRLFGG